MACVRRPSCLWPVGRVLSRASGPDAVGQRLALVSQARANNLKVDTLVIFSLVRTFSGATRIGETHARRLRGAPTSIRQGPSETWTSQASLVDAMQWRSARSAPVIRCWTSFVCIPSIEAVPRFGGCQDSQEDELSAGAES